MSMPLSHFFSAYPSPSPCPQVHSLHVCLYSCPAPFLFLNSLSPVYLLSINCLSDVELHLILLQYSCSLFFPVHRPPSFSHHHPHIQTHVHTCIQSYTWAFLYPLCHQFWIEVELPLKQNRHRVAEPGHIVRAPWGTCGLPSAGDWKGPWGNVTFWVFKEASLYDDIEVTKRMKNMLQFLFQAFCLWQIFSSYSLDG